MNKSIPDLSMDYSYVLASLEKAIISESCETEEEVTLIMAGDIFDTPVCKGAPIQVMGDFITKLTMAGIRILFIQGNHDRQDPNDPTAIPLVLAVTPKDLRYRVIHLCKDPIDVDGFLVSGLDYMAPEALKEQLKELPKTDILVLHQAFEEFLPFEGAFDLSSEDIPPQVMNVIVGDIHVAKDIPFGNGCSILSPGSLHRCTSTESAGGYWKYNKVEEEWQQRTLPCRDLFKHRLVDMDDLIACEASLKVHNYTGLLPVLHLTFPNTMLEQVKAFVEAHKEECIPILIKESSAKLSNEAPLVKEEGKLTLLEALPYVLNAETERGVYRLCEEVLTGDVSMATDAFIRDGLR